MNNYVVLDIETVPDYSLWQPDPPPPEKLKVEKEVSKAELKFYELFTKTFGDLAPEDAGKIHQSDYEKAREIAAKLEKNEIVTLLDTKIEKEKPPMAPLYAQRPIVISMAWFEGDVENLTVKKVDVISAKKYGDDEKKLLAGWSGWMAKYRPSIIDWNGRGFDLPVLTLRCFRHGVNMGWYYDQKDYRYRYSDDLHADLLDTMTEFGAVNRSGFRLDKIAKAIGLPGKYGIDGSMVEGMFKEGKIDEIETYCMTDTIQTAYVWLRQLLMKGRLKPDAYQKIAENFLIHLGTEQRFTEFIKLIDHETLLLNGSTVK